MTHLTTSGSRLAAAGIATAILLSGCSYDGITSVKLPFREGTGDGSYTVTVDLADASGLTPNSEVKVDDVTVGSVESLKVDGWKPVAVVRVGKDTKLPANAVARVGQKSLLGAKFLELDAPANPAKTALKQGAVIQNASAGNYPQTEQVLASLSLVLNGGGLQQIRTITQELNQVIDGREPQVRQFIERFRVFITSLDKQRNDILDAVARLDTLSTTLGGSGVLARAIDNLPNAFTTLEQNRADLTNALTALSTFGKTARAVVNESGDQLTSNLRNLRPALSKLADAGHDIVPALSIAATLPFPSNTSFPKMFQGDYGNLFLTVDASPELLARNLLTGFQLPGVGGKSNLMQAPPLGAGDGPPPVLGGLVPGLTDSLGLDNLLNGLTTGLGGAKNNNSKSNSSANEQSGLGGLLPGLLGLNKNNGGN